MKSFIQFVNENVLPPGVAQSVAIKLITDPRHGSAVVPRREGDGPGSYDNVPHARVDPDKTRVFPPYSFDKEGPDRKIVGGFMSPAGFPTKPKPESKPEPKPEDTEPPKKKNGGRGQKKQIMYFRPDSHPRNKIDGSVYTSEKD